MTLLSQLTEDYKNAMRNREEEKKTILNYVLAQVKNKKIELWKDPEDADVIQIIKKEVKAVKEAIWYLEKASKEEDLKTENMKLAVLESYLPTMMSREQTVEVLKKIVADLWIQDLAKERWKIMGEIMKDYKWKIDWSLVNEILNHWLAQI